MSNSQNVCYQCGSALIEVKKTVSKSNQPFPLTITIYRCSNVECQSRIDAKVKETTKRIKEQEEIKKQRALKKAKEMEDKKLLLQKSL